MITNFWNWLITSVTAGVNILNQLVSNNELSPFFSLFLVVIATMVIVKFILKPIFGGTGSDKAKKREDDNQ